MRQGPYPISVDQPHAELLALDLTLTQLMQHSLGNFLIDREIGSRIEGIDLADRLLGEARVAGQRAEQIAGSQLVAAAAIHAQGDDCRGHWAIW